MERLVTFSTPVFGLSLHFHMLLTSQLTQQLGNAHKSQNQSFVTSQFEFGPYHLGSFNVVCHPLILH